jgi:hypothetical protein
MRAVDCELSTADAGLLVVDREDVRPTADGHPTIAA